MKKRIVGEVSQERWLDAQKHELETWRKEPADGEDWNGWWYNAFNRYDFLKDYTANVVLEVGCGPYAKNISYVVSSLKEHPALIVLEDPLLRQYVSLGKSINRFAGNDKIVMTDEPLESLDKEFLAATCDVPNGDVNMVLCHNVLDHVRSVDECFTRMYDLLVPGGMLILGQDLSCDADFEDRPEEAWDTGCHPIVIGLDYLRPFVDKYEPVFNKVLPRDQGRNPSAHYGTLLFAGVKRA